MSGIENIATSVLLYLPFTIIIVLVLGYGGLKLTAMSRSENGISGYFNNFIQKFFGIKKILNKIQNIFWPEDNVIRDGRTGKSIQIDTILIGLGSLYILLMIILYNTDIYNNLKEKVSNGIFKVSDPIFNFFAPSTWVKVKRNISLKGESSYRGNVKDKYPILFGGVGLLIGFTIFMSLLVNNYNTSVKRASVQEFNKKMLEKTQKWLYLTIFTGVSLAIFSLLLYYAATTSSAPAFLTPLLIFVSATIMLAAVFVLFKDKILKYLDNPFVNIIYNTLFIIPCLLIDFINYIYFEFKNSPKIVYIIFALEILLIASLFIIPIITKWIYMSLGKEKNFGDRVDQEVEELKNRKIKINKAIKKIKTFNTKKHEFKKITVNNSSTTSSESDPNILKVFFDLKLKKSTTNIDFFTDFCMKNTGNAGTDGHLEYEGIMDIGTKKIVWNKIKTVSGFSRSFGTPEQRRQCQWERKSSDEAFIKKYLGVGETQPTYYANLPMTLNALKDTYNSQYRKDELDKAIEEKEKQLADEAGLNSDEGDEIKQVYNQFVYYFGFARNLISEIDLGGRFSSQIGTLNEGAWERILKKNLDNKVNKYNLDKMLTSYGFTHPTHCAKMTDAYKRRKCKEEYEKIVNHVQTNTKQLILFINTLEELDNRIKDLEKMKKNSNNFMDKGIQCLKEPVYFRKKVRLINHSKFLKLRPEEFSYNYSISCWFFIHSHPPNYKKSYSKYTKILNFNHEPVIAYNMKKNKLLIKSFKAKDINDRNNGTREKNKLVNLYVGEKFKLQKWHNVVVNYVGGTVDVFLNGDLVGSTKRVAPYKTFNNMVVGEEDGISGSICNVVYFPNYISNTKILLNYNYLKKKSPPVI